MTNITTGLGALDLLAAEEQGGSENSFTKLGSGDRKTVKVLSYGDLMAVQTYSIFKKVNTFTPEVPPTLSKRGFPIENLTPFDKAYKYFKDQSEDFNDEMSKAAADFRIKPRFAVGFYDLDAKECIVIDFSKNQTRDIMAVIQKNEHKLGKKAFELEKTGSGTTTKVTLSPLDLEDLTPEQEAAFAAAPEKFDNSKFEGLYFVQNEEQMVESLRVAGFNVTLIGYPAVAEKGETESVGAIEADVDPTSQF